MYVRLLDLNGELSTLTDVGALVLPGLDDVPAPVRMITDYAGSAFGVEALNASLDQVSIVLEKKLRENGLIDGFSEVIIHQVSRIAGLSVALYTAVSVDTFLTYGRSCQAHKEPCHPIALAHCLYRYALSITGESTAVVLQHGRCVDFVLVNNGHAVAAERLLVYARDDDGDKMVVQLLQAFAAVEKRGAELPAKVVWLVHDSASLEAESWFAEFKHRATFCSAELAADLPFYGNETVGISSGDQLFNALTVKDVLSNKTDQRLTLIADSVMPWLTGLAATACAVLLVWNVVAYFQLSSVKQTVSQLEGSAEFTKIGQLHQAMLTAEAERSPMITESAKFAAELQKTRVRDVRRVMMDIRASLSDLVMIRRVEVINSEGESPSILVEGKGVEFPGAVRGEELLSEALRSKGYEVNKRSLEIKKNDNAFSFLLKWREN
ncbi:MAG: hypothetical protein PSU93_00570 [Methylobacter sp.]|uniref:Uncharacterized protein n=1 Tax=Candidatus Methylobacter titanis TaxID=3053457 RepID=A0AA43TGW0_9GAMM|nr:hypothetical protein [Candidatus Methylobacter titanis]